MGWDSMREFSSTINNREREREREREGETSFSDGPAMHACMCWQNTQNKGPDHAVYQRREIVPFVYVIESWLTNIYILSHSDLYHLQLSGHFKNKRFEQMIIGDHL
jgi:hypothetical protein